MLDKIEKDHYYHIFNRGINSTIIFATEDNMTYFLKLVKKHLTDKVDIIAYCLMNNHFHFIVKIIEDNNKATQAFSNLFNAYAKAFNKQQNRTGTLFERPYKRIRIDNESYLKNLILYVHRNPENHNLIKNFQDYRFSSFNAYLKNKESIISKTKDYILSMFEDIDNFKHAHHTYQSGFENLADLNSRH
ncbi:transposase [Snuella sedimenti]|uniref:Transposase n=1 Tax=Snuella sedimenti TaxID=2798802 RepID=A0A8J7LMG7_9FLAO|nr:transposase [Snuella sedimenti]MBJ6367524.1 transposase [Snuella sedimenti]